MSRAPGPLLLAALAASVLAGCASAPRPAAPTTSVATGEFFMNVQGGAGALRVSVGGTGEPTLVLLHGLGADLEVWRAQLDHLRAAHRVIAYDQRGHGGSDRAPAGGYTVDALAADLDRVAQALKLERVVLVGHSLSGEVITAYAGQHPEKVQALVYLDALGDFQALPRAGMEADLAREAGFGPAEWRAAFSEMLGDRARPATRERVLAGVARTDPAALAGLRRSAMSFSARQRLGRWKGPAVAIEVADRRLPVQASAVLGLPRVDVPHVSHWLMLDDPAAVDRALDDFLATLPVSPAAR